MHELPIAAAIVEQAVQAAAAHGATRIETIEVEIGRRRQVVPEALQIAFAATSEGTIAEGARLEIVEIEMEAVCRVCGHRFKPEIDLYLCPRCEQADVRIVAGDDMILKSITAQTPEESASQEPRPA
ncbi:MAG TPA: hydrogenase maturation nickel metallochaperone HypA [Phycisphaerae bacterium]|nr:hydrogenase maturation nickel metallochaperone HypA [Phycisphaerae bacterium]HOJ73790.1 hydrogenase maturation nickel metallochaperone HypA [Phycisphaerae bacterium]HOM50437.1 hydrogenase maturation nickel metallochaperone HypA [Phycisphaerae bacterium]HON65434.1 hydrogenase maturation nickel metallochaperone HypA [Phycisphaerae bacterium]HOQ85707.1 hydrogenase maturation nickel metallochaperone HypA [Phycisphaerae bacterium]